jgi:hypothetical protein
MSMVDTRLYPQHAAASREIAFIDPGVADLGDLLRGLRPEVHAIVLSPAGNPVRQMADALDRTGELRAIHIIAHGASGEIAFTAGPVSLATISAGARDLARIGAALDIDGELLLWSCETGRGARGERFIDALSRNTGALVAASTGIVGAAAKGGSWKLDTSFGATIAAPLTPIGILTFTGVMTAFSWTGPGGTAIKPVSGTWSTTTNWSPNGTPGSADTVTLGGNNSAAGAYTVTLDTSPTVTTLTISATKGATLAVGAHTLTVSGTLSLSNSVDSLTLAGSTVSAGTLSNSGTISSSATSSLSIGAGGRPTRGR